MSATTLATGFAIIFSAAANDNKRRPVQVIASLMKDGAEIANKSLKVAKKDVAATEEKLAAALLDKHPEAIRPVGALATNPIFASMGLPDGIAGLLSAPVKAAAQPAASKVVKAYRPCKPTANNVEVAASILKAAKIAAAQAGEDVGVAHLGAIVTEYTTEYGLLPRRVEGIKGYIAKLGFTL